MNDLPGTIAQAFSNAQAFFQAEPASLSITYQLDGGFGFAAFGRRGTEAVLLVISGDQADAEHEAAVYAQYTEAGLTR
jgi:hypothetical protein